MQGREFSEQFIRQICTDVLRGKSQTEFLITVFKLQKWKRFFVEIIKDISRIKKE